MLSFLKLIIVL